MKKFLPLPFALVALFLMATCEREWNNPFDPNNTLDPEAWAPENLYIANTGITVCRLTWTYTGPANIQGFKVDRKKGDEAWQVAMAALPKETRTWNDTTLIPQTGLIYQYRVYSYAGNNISSLRTITTQAAFPEPSDLILTKLSELSYRLGWKDNSIGEQGFKIDRKSIENEWIIGYGTVGANENSFVDTNVFVGKSTFNVEYRVYAFYNENESGRIYASTAAALTPPTTLTITKNTISQVTLNWQDNSTGEEGFKIERKYEGGDWSLLATVTTSNFQDNNFELNSKIYYRVSAFIGNYTSDWIENEFDATIPPPYNLQIVQLSDVSFKLTWQDNSNGEEGFKIDRKTGDEAWVTAFGVVAANVNSFVDTNVFLNKNALQVSYKVYGFAGSYNSASVFASTQATLSTPGNFQLQVNSQSSVSLSWSYNGTGHQGFKIDRKTNDGEWQDAFAVLTPVQTNFIDNTVNLQENAYRYRVYSYVMNNVSAKVEKYISKPTVTTGNIYNITGNAATGGGNVSNDGGSPVSQRGVCWSTNPNPTSANSTTNNGGGTGSYTSNLTGLSVGTTYYVRAYAISSAGTSYGGQVTFSTANLPTVTTANITNITGNTATGGGNVTSDGGSQVTQRGVCWSTSPNPTTANQKTIDGSGTGSFVSNMTGLSMGVTYYVRAYAINANGTSYGTQISFTTANLPTVTTANITNITGTSATGGGNVTNDGGSPVTQRGVCWSTSPNPTIANQSTNNGNGTGSFTSNLTNLNSNTNYYVRAYATSSQGTAYGNQVSFTTLTIHQCGNNFTDPRDNKVYGTVQIGTQCWMKQNLNIGTRINATNNQTNNSVIEKYCYMNSESNCDLYGGLYQWDEMMQYSTI